MPRYIPKDFAPNEKTIAALQANGVVQAFLDQYVTQHFIEYWTELKDDKKPKGKKEAWQTTYRNWARSAFQGRLGRIYEDDLHKRSGPYGKCKPNVVQEVAAGLIAQDMPAKPFKPPPNYRLPDPPADTGERMTQDEAFAKLDKMFQVKS